MKPFSTLQKILMLSLLFFAAPKAWTSAEFPVPKMPYFRTQYQRESQFILEAITTDLTEQIFYAKYRRLPEVQQFSVSSSLKKRPGSRFAVEGNRETPLYELVVTLETNRPSLHLEVEVKGPIWSPELYTDLAAALSKEVGLSLGEPKQQGDLRLLSSLTDSTAVTIETENLRISKLLEDGFVDPFHHEQAAALLGAFALRDHAGDFSDVRLPLCRMTAHLCMARLLGRQTSPSITGRVAEAMLFTLMNNEISALEKLDGLDKSDPMIMKWVRTLQAYNTMDYRYITNVATASPIENVARFNSFASSVDVDLAWNKLTKDANLLPDFVRLAEASGYSVETGHQLLRLALPQELQEIATVYERHFGRKLSPPELVQELNVIPEGCFTLGTNGTASINVIGWGQWAAFLQRHLCLTIVEGFKFLNNKWSVHDKASAYAATFDRRFDQLRLYPFVKRFNCTDGAAYRGIFEEGQKIYATTPHLVPVRAWAELFRPVPGAEEPWLNELEFWLWHGPPPGTAFEGGLYRRQQGTNRFKLHEMAPYDRQISYRILVEDYDKEPNYAQAEALYRSVLPYASYAMVRVAGTVKDQPDRYEELMAKACQLDPSRYLSLGNYCAEHGLDEKAEGYYLKGDELCPDSVAMASAARWRVKYYLGRSLNEKARRIADEAGEVYSCSGLQAKAEFLEATGLYSDAFDWYSKIEERYGDSSYLTEFCARYKAKTGENRFEAEYSKRIKGAFPNGFESVTLKDFSSAPKDGVLLMQNSQLLRGAGMMAGDVIVALNGIRVRNVAQYDFKRESSAAPEMILIVWQNGLYNEIHASPPNHRFGVDISNYVK